MKKKKIKKHKYAQEWYQNFTEEEKEKSYQYYQEGKQNPP